MATDSDLYVDHVDYSRSSWKRPEGPPRVWRVVNGRRKTESGEVLRFSIQEVPEELEKSVVEFMMKHFVVEEPITVDQGLVDDPLGLREIRTLWRDLVRQGVSIVALKVNSDPAAIPEIAGVNILNVITAEDEADARSLLRFRSRAVQKIIGVQFDLASECDIFAKYGIDKYLNALGLSVDPSLRGQGLGEEIIRARDDIGLAYQIPVSKTIFTATASQILASRVGYEVLLQRKYSELLDDEGKVAFPGVKVDLIKVMGKRLG